MESRDPTTQKVHREVLPLPQDCSRVNGYAVTARAEVAMTTSSTDVLVVSQCEK